MAFLIAIPIILLLSFIQLTVVGNLPLMDGVADILLLTIIAWSLQDRTKNSWFWALSAGLLLDFVSATPSFGYTVSYLSVVIITSFFRKRIWQTPILAMFATTIMGTVIQHGLFMFLLVFNGTPADWYNNILRITLPSILLNLLLSLPVYLIVSDLANWIYPIEEDV